MSSKRSKNRNFIDRDGGYSFNDYDLRIKSLDELRTDGPQTVEVEGREGYCLIRSGVDADHVATIFLWPDGRITKNVYRHSLDKNGDSDFDFCPEQYEDSWG